MQDHKNTIAGWVLFAGIVALGASIVTGEMFHGERPEKMGYPIEGVVLEGESAAVDKPIDFSVADAAKGEQVFKKCAACHVVAQGGANGIGPNLWAVVGGPIGKHAAGFAYSEALSGIGGNWDWKSLDHWLASPRAMAPGTKMTFAGLGDPQDRADVSAYLNANGTNLPLPAAPAEAAPAAAAAAPAAEGAAAPAAEGNAAAPAPAKK